MLTLRCVKKTRAFLCPSATTTSTSNSATTSSIFLYSTNTTFTSTPNYQYNPSSSVQLPGIIKYQPKDVVFSFREWFKTRGNRLMDRIFEILSVQGDSHLDELTHREIADSALSGLNLRLNEALVLDVLDYGKDVLPCLKFFDWAGRQPGFFHTHATYNAIFKILSKAKLMSLMLDFLDCSMQHKSPQKVRFCSVLVVGYAVAGKPEVALQLFGKMRFQGIDLDKCGYHVLLNALVEDGCYDVVETIAKQIRMQGLECEVTHSITVKSYCKQNEVEKGEEYFRGLMADGFVFKRRSYIVCFLVEGYCKSERFDKAWKLVEGFGESYVYDVWIRELLRARKLDGALQFLKRNNRYRLPDRFVPDVFRYNTLIWTLLRENRLVEICDLLIEMQQNDIVPDEFTMNCVLCFFCKAGMADVALDLFSLKGELGLSPSSLAYNYLVNTLCQDGSVDDAYRVLSNSIGQGYFPWKKTFTILADALCRLDKLDMMKELFIVGLERDFVPSPVTSHKFIAALCRNSRAEEGYIIHGLLSRLNRASSSTYCTLIHSFNRSNRGDIAARLVLQMQAKGLDPTRGLFITVIIGLCGMENAEKQVFTLMGTQLTRQRHSSWLYNLFIDGAGRGMKPALAREVYDTMIRNGIAPTVVSNVLMLRSYLWNDRISDALHFFGGLASSRRMGKRLWNTMIVGLCKSDKPDLALSVFSEMRRTDVKVSRESYEELVKLLCKHERYDRVINLISDCVCVCRRISSFIGNVLLYQSLKTRQLYRALQRARSQHDETSWIWTIGELINVFSDPRREFPDVEQLEELVQRCFPLDLYTYNMLLRKLCLKNMDDACKLFHNLCRRGYTPNRWTYLILVHGFYKHGRTTEAIIWTEEMCRSGFDPDAEPRLCT